MGRVIPTRETEIVAPSRLPLDLEFVRLHLKSITDAEDILIESWIEAAGNQFRTYTGRELILATREYWLDEFPAYGMKIELPRPPLQSVLSVSYVSDGDTLATFTDGGSPELPLYEVVAPSGIHARPGYIFPKNRAAWPVAACQPGSVRIRYTCGYGDHPEDIPANIKAVLCSMVGTFDQFRSEVHQSDRGAALDRMPFGIDLMMDDLKSSALLTTVPRSAQ